ncbi:MAG: DUF4350 domain-containing protein [Oryzihumus sp.]
MAVVACGLAALAALALATAQPSQDLDPDGTGPGGGRALVEVLRHHGVDVQVVRSAQALVDAAPGAGTTVVMADPEYLGHDSTTALAHASLRADRLVLLSPTAEQLAALGLPLAAIPADVSAELMSGCSTSVARADDTLTEVDEGLVVTEAGRGRSQLCFVLSDPRRASAAPDAAFGAAMATLPATADHPEVLALGMAPAFSNRALATASHAGLAVRALGHSPRLVWYQPGLGDLENASGAPSPSPWPAWLGPAAVVLATAVLVLAVARGRRMGALVTERLPVVVRAVETTESRGRIYRRARDRERAARILRVATTTRLARRLALPTTELAALVPAASAASGMPAAEVAALLAGAPPTTDVELHTIAVSLSRLEERVRTA